MAVPGHWRAQSVLEVLQAPAFRVTDNQDNVLPTYLVPNSGTVALSLGKVQYVSGGKHLFPGHLAYTTG